MALRQQLGLVARQAWMLDEVLPLLSFSEGRTFRLAVRLRRQLQPGEEECLGLLRAVKLRCAGTTLLKLREWPPCCCADGRWTISGPLWIGPLQDHATRGASERSGAGEPLDRDLQPPFVATSAEDPGSPPLVWPTAELAKRLGCGGPPPLNQLVQALHRKGFQAFASG